MAREPHVEFFKGEDGRWWWRVKAGNGRIIAIGGEGFVTRRNVVRAFWTMVADVHSRMKVRG